MKMKNTSRRQTIGDIKNSLLNWKYISTPKYETSI